MVLSSWVYDPPAIARGSVPLLNRCDRHVECMTPVATARGSVPILNRSDRQVECMTRSLPLAVLYLFRTAAIVKLSL